MDQLNIPIILGASRPERQSIKVAKLVLQIAQTFPEIKTQLVDVKDFNQEYDDDKSLPEFHPIVETADAFIIVTPEYNRGYPGKLKSLLDTEYDSYLYKPVLPIGVSDGAVGGARGIENLTPSLVQLGMIMTRLKAYFPNVDKTFDEQGQPIDPKKTERLTKLIKDFIKAAQAFKMARKFIQTKSDA